MQVRTLMGFTVVVAVSLWSAVGVGKSAACGRAESELAAARATLSSAIRTADDRASDYQQCVESRGQPRCKAEQKAWREALKAKRDAQAAYRYAVARAKQACS